MPTYEYQCDACEHRFDEFQSMTAKPLRLCPECGERKLRRLIGAGAGLIFKGSGFYETDYRSDKYKKAAAADKPSSTNGTSEKADGKKKTETKSETKSEKKQSASK
jgi:putative FmdB family regulatory protein